MTSSRTMSAAIRALLPEGAIWAPAPDGALDELLEGLGETVDEVREEIEKLAAVRDPSATANLYDLEVELGVVPDDNLDEASRRAVLAGIKAQTPGTGSADNLQASLRAAGFDVYVLQNDPTIDPNSVIDGSFEMCYDADPPDAQCSTYGDVICGFGGGELVVNADALDAVAIVPQDSRRWPFVFWICGGISGWEHFDDWQMEWYGTAAWTAGSDAIVTKTMLRKHSGIRALNVAAKTTVDVTLQFMGVLLSDDLRAFYRLSIEDGDGRVENLAPYTVICEDVDDFG